MSSIYILTNSPGEVSGWVKPVASEFLEVKQDAEVVLVILPCTYASGMEEEFGKKIKGIDRTIRFSKVFRESLAIRNQKIILQLGGDPFYGAILSLMLNGKWMIYTSRPRWKFFVSHYFIPNISAVPRFVNKNISAEKYTVTGDLMVDSTPELFDSSEIKKNFSLGKDEEIMTFLAGSRPFEYYQGFSFFIDAAKKILARKKISQVLLPIAPTVDEKLFHEGLRNLGVEWIGDKAEEVIWDGPGRIRFVRNKVFEAIKASKLVVAFPGTNNLQVASLGTPLLVVLPLNYAEEIPLDGLPGLIPLSFPGAKRVKKKLVMWYNSHEKYVSLPNRLTGRNIVPEHRYIMTPDMVADLAIELLDSPKELERIRKGYKSLSLERGAAKNIVRHIFRFLER